MFRLEGIVGEGMEWLEIRALRLEELFIVFQGVGFLQSIGMFVLL